MDSFSDDSKKIGCLVFVTDSFREFDETTGIDGPFVHVVMTHDSINGRYVLQVNTVLHIVDLEARGQEIRSFRKAFDDAVNVQTFELAMEEVGARTFQRDMWLAVRLFGTQVCVLNIDDGYIIDHLGGSV